MAYEPVCTICQSDVFFSPDLHAYYCPECKNGYFEDLTKEQSKKKGADSTRCSDFVTPLLQTILYLDEVALGMLDIGNEGSFFIFSDLLLLAEKGGDKALQLQSNYSRTLASFFFDSGVEFFEEERFLEALAFFHNSRQIYENLYLSAPDEYSHDLACLCLSQGNTRFSLNDCEDAISDYDRMIGLMEGELENNLEWEMHNLANGYINRARSKAHTLDQESCFTDYDRAIEILKKLWDEGDVEILPALADAHLFRASARDDVQQYEEAIWDYEEAISIIENVQRGNHTETVTSLVSTYMDRGRARGRIEDYHGAIEDFDRAIDMAERLVRDGNEQILANLAWYYLNRGHIYEETGKIEQAIQDFDWAVEIYEKLSLLGKRINLSNLVWVFKNRGNIFAQQGNFTRAIEDYSDAINRCLLLVEEGNSEMAEDLSRAYTSRGIAHGELEQFNLARQNYDQAIEICEEMIAGGSNWMGRYLAWNYSIRGVTQGALECYEQAIMDYRTAIRIQEQLKNDQEQFPKKDPNQSRDLALIKDLALNYKHQGDAKSELRQYDEAVRDYCNAIQVLMDCPQPLQLELAPVLVSAHMRRAIARGNLYQYHLAMKDFEETVKIFEKSIHLEADELLWEMADIYMLMDQKNKSLPQNDHQEDDQARRFILRALEVCEKCGNVGRLNNSPENRFNEPKTKLS